jgi:hypothetical protein
MTDEEAEAMLDAVLKAKHSIMGDRAIAGDAVLREAAEKAAADHAAAAGLAKRNMLLNLQARVARRGRISAAPDAVLGIQAEVRGTNTPLHGGRFSAEAESKTLSNVYVGGMVNELDKAGLFQAMRGGAIEREWTRELFELSKDDDGKPGVTGNAQALAISKVVNRYQNLAKADANRAGAAIGDYSGYITRTSHDADKVRSAGFDAWSKDILPKLDPRTFSDAGVEDAAGLAKFMSGGWHGLATGIHLTEEGAAESWKDPGFTGPGNMAARLSEGRVFHFKDADAWLDYNKQYGIGTPLDAVVNGFNRLARSTALMSRWGTNPRAEFAADLKYFAESLRDTNPEAAMRVASKAHGLQTEFNWLDGTNDRPVNNLGARVGSYLRMIQSMSKLGLVVASHFSALGSKGGELAYHGIPLLQAYGNIIGSLVRGRGTGETKQIMDLLLAGTEGMQRNILGKFRPDDTLPGTLSKAANLQFRLSGLTPLLNSSKAGTEFALSRNLGSMLDRSYDALPPQEARVLSLYRISPDEWNMLRLAPGHPEVGEGRQFLTPDAATRIAPETVEAHLRAQGGVLGPDASAARVADQVSAYQENLALRLHALFHDVAEKSIGVPGVAEHALMYGNNLKGTALGEALRAIMQFKQFPLSMMRQNLGRSIYGNPGNPMGMVGGVIHTAVASLVLGYIGLSAKDILKGNTPRDPLDPRTWEAALLAGGGYGVLEHVRF